MKKIYQAPTIKVHKVRPAAIICTSPTCCSTNAPEEENVVFEAPGRNGYSDGMW